MAHRFLHIVPGKRRALADQGRGCELAKWRILHQFEVELSSKVGLSSPHAADQV